jgi:hypothetical protein
MRNNFKSFFVTFLLSIQAHAFVYLDYGTYNKGAPPVGAPMLWDGEGNGFGETNTEADVVTFYVNPDLSALSGSYTPTITSAQWVQAVIAAVNAWNSTVCTSRLQVRYGGTTTSISDPVVHQNVLIYDNSALGAGQCSASAGACAAPSAWSNGSMSSCTIWLVGANDYVMATNGAANKYDIATILVHEIGHCLGLEHTSEPSYTTTNPFLSNAHMYYAASAGRVVHDLTQDERDAITCMYPTATGNSYRDTCLSYHGTNGGAAISGVQTGGPQQEYGFPDCGSGQPGIATVAYTGEDGGGCATNAIARTHTLQASSTPSEIFLNFAGWILSLGLIWVLFRAVQQISKLFT